MTRYEEAQEYIDKEFMQRGVRIVVRDAGFDEVWCEGIYTGVRFAMSFQNLLDEWQKYVRVPVKGEHWVRPEHSVEVVILSVADDFVVYKILPETGLAPSARTVDDFRSLFQYSKGVK